MALRRDAVWTAADVFASAGLAFVFRLLIAKMLSPHNFGIAAMVLATWYILQVINEFGLTAALIQKGKEPLSTDLVQTTFVGSAAVSLLLIVLTVCLVAPLSAFYYHAPEVGPLTAAIALGLAGAPFSTISAAFLYRDRRFRDIAIIKTAATVISIAIAGVVLLVTKSPWVVVYQTVVNQLLNAAGLYWFARWPVGLTFVRERFKEVVNFSGLVFLNDLTVSLAGSLPIVIIGRMLGAADAGLFSLAVFLTDTVRKSLMSIFNRVMFVHYSQNQKDFGILRDAFKSTVNTNCRIVFPAMMAIILFAPAVLVHFLGAEWGRMASTLQVLAVSVMIHAAGGTTSTLYKAIGKPGLDLALFALTSIVILVPAMFIGAHYMGMLGAAIAIAVTKLISIVVRQVIIDRMIGDMAGDIIKSLGVCLFQQGPLVLAWGAGLALGWSGNWIADTALACVGGLGVVVISFDREIKALAQHRFFKRFSW